jgi:hypothetical protein
MSESTRKDHSESVRNFYRKQGAKAEQQRIIELIERLPFIWAGTTQMIQTSRDEVIQIINVESQKNNESVW